MWECAQIVLSAVHSAEMQGFPSLVIDTLAKDPDLMKSSGQILLAAEQVREYGVKDINGKQSASSSRFFGSPAQANPAVVE